MIRFLQLVLHEFKLARTTLPIHAVAILEPMVMYFLLTYILVQPTMPVHVTQTDTPAGQALVEGMRAIGSPIGEPYIDPILTKQREPSNMRQVITIEDRSGRPTAVQRYNLIDFNLVKNFRNRLTSAALYLWNAELGPKAVTVVQRPSLPKDIFYNVYFGMAMLPLGVFIAAAMLGAVLTAHEFEFNTILEYRLAPTPAWLVVTARLVRLVLTALAGGGLMLLTIGLRNGYWPDSTLQVLLILTPLAVLASCLGMIAGLLTRATLPAFLIALVASFFSWIAGDSFKPAVSIGGWYEAFSRFMPNTYTVEWLFPRFYGNELASSATAALVLCLVAAVLVGLTLFVYQRRVYHQE